MAPSLAEPAELQESELGLSFCHQKKFPIAGAMPVLTHDSGMGHHELLQEETRPWMKGRARETDPPSPHLPVALPPISKYRLLFVNELAQCLLSSVLTRKRAWGLLMEKSLSLSALQCGYSYKENRIPCGIWGGGREKEQKL